MMTYDEAVAYIKECTKFGIKLGLDRMQAILDRLGHPEKQFQSIHIAGTNGKGTTTAMFDAVFREFGFKTGRYNSPHLSSYRERFSLNNQPISKERLAEIVGKIKPVLESVTNDGFGAPTEFEVGTILAFQYFAEEKVDLAIIEVGMGGRFDATNVIQPVLSVITHIALDHQEYLGDTLEKIAFEKAGIIKPGVPVVIGLQEPEIELYFQEIAKSRQAPFYLVSRLKLEKINPTEKGTNFTVKGLSCGETEISIQLLGRHQAENCLNVLAGLELLKVTKLLGCFNVNFDKAEILSGLAKATWPGRLERIPEIEPLKLYLDGTHNPDGAKALVSAIKEIYPGKPVDLMVGILNNRPLGEMASILGEIAGKVIVTLVPDPKSAPVEELYAAFNQQGIETIIEPDQQKALKLLLASQNQVAVVTGSLYLIGYIRSLLYKIGD